MKTILILCLIVCILIIISLLYTINYLKKQASSQERLKNTFRSYYQCLMRWLIANREQIKISEYLFENSYHNIAIYGNGSFTDLLIDELENDNIINVSYIVDKQADKYKHPHRRIIKPEQMSTMPDVDLIIITPINYYFQILTEIQNLSIQTKTIPLDYLIYDLK